MEGHRYSWQDVTWLDECNIKSAYKHHQHSGFYSNLFVILFFLLRFEHPQQATSCQAEPIRSILCWAVLYSVFSCPVLSFSVFSYFCMRFGPVSYALVSSYVVLSYLVLPYLLLFFLALISLYTCFVKFSFEHFQNTGLLLRLGLVIWAGVNVSPPRAGYLDFKSSAQPFYCKHVANYSRNWDTLHVKLWGYNLDDHSLKIIFWWCSKSPWIGS